LQELGRQNADLTAKNIAALMAEDFLVDCFCSRCSNVIVYLYSCKDIVFRDALRNKLVNSNTQGLSEKFGGPGQNFFSGPLIFKDFSGH
jgi:hypothetical protein